eukprot:560507_1
MRVISRNLPARFCSSNHERGCLRIAHRSFVTAAQINSFGGPDVIQINNNINLEVREPLRSDEVLIEVEASSLNHVDCWMRRGYGGKLFGNMRESTFPLTLGRDCVGRISEVGDNVWDWKAGERVVCATMPTWAHGSHTTHARARATDITSVPRGLSAEMCAAFPYVALTAYEAVKSINALRGEKVLVLGGSGAVGGFAIQLLAARGCEVFATARAKHHPRCREYGASTLFDYTTEAFHDFLSDIDAVIDCGRKPTPDELCLHVLKQGGRFSTLVGDIIQDTDSYGTLKGTFTGASSLISKKVKWRRLRGASYNWVFVRSGTDRLAELTSHVEQQVASGVEPVLIDRIFKLSDTQKAHESMESEQLNGKVILTI